MLFSVTSSHVSEMEEVIANIKESAESSKKLCLKFWGYLQRNPLTSQIKDVG